MVILPKMASSLNCKASTLQRRFRLELRTAVFALPVAAVILTGARLTGGSHGPELSIEEGSNTTSAGTTQTDSLMLDNRTDTAFVALAYHPETARPLKSKIKVDVGEKRAFTGPSFYVAAGDATALWPCDTLEQYEDYTLHLYRVPSGAENVVRAPLARSVVLAAERLETARSRHCRLKIDEL